MFSHCLREFKTAPPLWFKMWIYPTFLISIKMWVLLPILINNLAVGGLRCNLWGGSTLPEANSSRTACEIARPPCRYGFSLTHPPTTLHCSVYFGLLKLLGPEVFSDSPPSFSPLLVLYSMQVHPEMLACNPRGSYGIGL